MSSSGLEMFIAYEGVFRLLALLEVSLSEYTYHSFGKLVKFQLFAMKQV